MRFFAVDLCKKVEALIVKKLNLSEILMIDLEQQAYSKLEEAGEDSRGIWEPTLLRGFQSGKLKSYCCNLKSLNYTDKPLTLPQRRAVRRIID
jgi:hypothetical protein